MNYISNIVNMSVLLGCIAAVPVCATDMRFTPQGKGFRARVGRMLAIEAKEWLLPFYATMGNKQDLELALSEGIQFNVDTTDFQGNTALHNAAREGHSDIVQMLLEHGANPTLPVQKPNALGLMVGATLEDVGKTALQLAQENKHTKTAVLLMSWQPSKKSDAKATGLPMQAMIDACNHADQDGQLERAIAAGESAKVQSLLASKASLHDYEKLIGLAGSHAQIKSLLHQEHTKRSHQSNEAASMLSHQTKKREKKKKQMQRKKEREGRERLQAVQDQQEVERYHAEQAAKKLEQEKAQQRIHEQTEYEQRQRALNQQLQAELVADWNDQDAQVVLSKQARRDQRRAKLAALQQAAEQRKLARSAGVMPSELQARKNQQLAANSAVPVEQRELEQRLLKAAEKGDSATVRACLAHNVNVNCVTDWGSTSLMVAAKSGTHDVVQLLLDHRADVNHVNCVGDTALNIEPLKRSVADRSAEKIVETIATRITPSAYSAQLVAIAALERTKKQ